MHCPTVQQLAVPRMARDTGLPLAGVLTQWIEVSPLARPREEHTQTSVLERVVMQVIARGRPIASRSEHPYQTA
jgi:hypothetical protein